MKMPLRESDLDLLIKHRIKQEVEEIEVPPVDEQWQKFNARYAQTAKRPIWRSRVTWAALILITVASLITAKPEQATAFGDRIIKTLKLIVGKTTQNKTTAETRQSAPVKPAVPQVGEAKVIDNEQELSLDQAQKLVNFKIAQPTYLPEGTSVKKLTLNKITSDLYRVTILYEIQGQFFTLTQRNTVGDNSDSFLYDTDDASVADLDINGKPGYQIKTKDGAATIVWRTTGLILELSGKFPEDQLVKIARSVY